ncbi:hypothetical protein SUDANB105_07804 [Streptomyces sp. enrichment culture]
MRRRTTAQALAQRSRIVLECDEGHSITEVSRRLRITPDTVRTWRRRLLEGGLDGLCDDPRPGVPRKITDADVERVIVKTLEETPKNATHWSTRSMAAVTGMSQSTVSRIWRAFALAPHRSQTFKLSTDPLFIDKVRDVVGLYLDPPEKALVLCVDEKSQIQALDRSQPVLPMVPGLPERRSHDYVRAGTTTLFAALEVATGKVIGSLHCRHRAAEFKKFLTKLDKEVPEGLDVHLILDNYATHKTPDIKKWLLARPRFHLQFTPMSASWLNLVERWFAELAEEAQARRPPLRPGPRTRHPQLARRLEQPPQTLRLDEDSRRDPRQGRGPLPPILWFGSLAHCGFLHLVSEAIQSGRRSGRAPRWRRGAGWPPLPPAGS